MKILIVEDTSDFLMDAIIAFQDEHDFIARSRFDEEASQAVVEYAPEVGLLDMRLPRGSGRDFGALLASKHIPFVYVTRSRDGVLIKDKDENILLTFEGQQEKTPEVWKKALEMALL